MICKSESSAKRTLIQKKLKRRTCLSFPGTQVPSNNTEIEKRLWDAADELKANSKLKSSEYSTPVLGLVFLRWADYKFSIVEEVFQKKATKSKRKREIGITDYQTNGVMYLPEEVRFSYLMKLPEKSDIGTAINDPMKSIDRVKSRDWSLNPGRYVGVEKKNDVLERTDQATLLKEFRKLSTEAHELEAQVAKSLSDIMEEF